MNGGKSVGKWGFSEGWNTRNDNVVAIDLRIFCTLNIHDFFVNLSRVVTMKMWD